MKKISFAEFDQTPTEGWRALEAIGKFKEAGESIIAYIADNSEIENYLTSSQLCLLWFHAGQMYALDNNYKKAISCFKNAEKENGLADILGPAASHYLQATIAFLKRDNEAVTYQLNEILKIPLVDYPSGRFVFIPGKVYDMREHPNATYKDIYNRPFKLPPLSEETHWLTLNNEDLDQNTQKAIEAAKRYNINFQRSQTKK